MSDAIRTTGLTKHYGKKVGIADLDLEVATGTVFGYLGPNGAGKTTTIRLLLDLIRPTRGSAHVLGRNCRTQTIEIRRRVGYLPGEFSLYDHMTAWELSRFFGRLRGGLDTDYVRHLADRLDLDLHSPIAGLSKGNKQKVGVVQALMHRPELLILDEPTSALDPLVQHEVHLLLKEAAAEGRTVILSSHVLSEVEAVAETVGIVREGKLVAIEAMKALKDRALRRVEVRFANPIAPDSFERVPGITGSLAEGNIFRFTVQGSIDPLIKAVARFKVEHLESRDADLEEIFLAYYRTGGADAS